ncbi:glutamate/glutamine/aspartate/asparagine transport system permease protein BztC [Octadecabacter antarcticus 307]|uniref:Glutamate/glutamine/aspartate/asparagine transport system permease protein BztC n=1 Tax=Octadecabacter antarcticus 307 TaxID=391626 RepID=M9RC35_9RHOB|nr:glutamate/glutamine/aspartate/asparagine transport system permease protein BztC [Octadecabacter antarcticus 307]
MSETHAQTVSYVRDKMIDEQAPPIAETGVIKWVRENLFSGWLNILLTVLSLFVVYLALSLVLPWAFGGVWNAGSLTECREVLFSFYKSSHGGACWAVIEDRWLQIMFGFYPPELYWRPVLAFALFFVALAPVLFAEKVPGQMIWFSFAYPFIATWLIWGGSFWAPFLAAMGFIVGVLAHKALGKITGPIVANLGAVVAALLWWAAIMGPINDGLNKMIGSGRLESAIATLQEAAVRLPAEVAAMEAISEEQASGIAEAVEVKNGLLQSMDEIRIEEFAIEAQIETKEVALRQLVGAEESLDDLAAILNDWDGSPTAASDASEADVSKAQDATDRASGLIQDVSDLIGDAIGDIENDTVDPSVVVTDLVATAAAEDPSILADVDALVTKSTLIEPLVTLQERATGITTQSSMDEIGVLRADIMTVIASFDADITTLKDIQGKIIASNVEDLVSPQAALLSQMKVLAGLRDDATVVAQDTFRVSSTQSSGRRFLSSLTSLLDQEVSLPELREQTAALLDALPRNQRGMIAVSQLPDDASNEKRAALNSYLDAKSDELNIQATISGTYAELGRVGLRPVDSRQIGGFMLALIIGIAGIVLSLPLGILLALGRQSNLFIVKKICVTFIEVIRGVPLIVWLFTGSLLLNYFLPPGTNFDLLLRVIIMVTLFAAAYIAEVIRGGLAALATGQYEGADSLGLSYWQSMQLIVLPQAMKISIPGIVNTFIGLFKDTVLVVFIGLSDPIGFSNLIRADTDWNGIYWELFVFIGALFFLFCFSMGRYSLYLEKKLQREHR